MKKYQIKISEQEQLKLDSDQYIDSSKENGSKTKPKILSRVLDLVEWLAVWS